MKRAQSCATGIGRWLMGAGAAVLGVCASGAESADAPAANAQKTTMGFVLTVWQPAVVDGTERQQCPTGFTHSNVDNYKQQISDPQARAEFERKYLVLNNTATADDDGTGGKPDEYELFRGAGGASVEYNPTSAKDQLPYPQIQSKVAYGLNLDGTTDGRATRNSCKHEKFVSPEGQPGIDNQLYRLIGCSRVWRKGGPNYEYSQQMFVQDPYNRVLMEISNVTDERNSPHVKVTFYKGVDVLLRDAADKPIPWQPQRIDVRYPQLITHTDGKIVDGVLETEPVDRYVPRRIEDAPVTSLLRGMRVQLKLTDTTADGLVGGYEDFATWYRSYSKTYTASASETWSPPSTYATGRSLLDGYPDPKTRECTAISAAYHVQAVRAMIVHPAKDDPLVVDGELKLAQKNVGMNTAPGSGGR